MVRAKFLVLAAFVFLASVQGQGSKNDSFHKKKQSSRENPQDVVPGESTMALPEDSNESSHKKNLANSKENIPRDFVSTYIVPANPDPKTTTVAPTTTVDPKTTTVAPTTTLSPNTTVAPITTPAPPVPTTPLPPPAKGKWAYFDNKNNKTCVIVQMAVQFNITYQAKDGSVNQAVFDLPENTTKVAAGSCGNTTQSITLVWPVSSDPAVNFTNNFTLTFDKNTTTSRFSLQKLVVFIVQDAEHFPDSNDVDKTLSLSHVGDQFSTSLGWSYRCVKMQDIVLESKDSNSTVAVNDVQFQAFHIEKGTAFGSANDCDYVDVPDIVPIAVGCALGALVLIVLIAYLVGRRRSRAQGYLSM